MNRSFTSHSHNSVLSGSENPIIRHRHKVEPYVSPFILNAKRKAEERAKFARLKLKNRHSPGRSAWDKTPANTGLFDPTIRKQEIFRLGPASNNDVSKEKIKDSDISPNRDENLSQPRISQTKRLSRNSMEDRVPLSSSSRPAPKSSSIKPSLQGHAHYMAPKQETKPMHEVSHGHDKSPRPSMGKLTVRNQFPKRTPRPHRSFTTAVVANKERIDNSATISMPPEGRLRMENHQHLDYFSDGQEDPLYPKTSEQNERAPLSRVERSTSPVDSSVAQIILENEFQAKDLERYQMALPPNQPSIVTATTAPSNNISQRDYPPIQTNNSIPIVAQPQFRDPRHIEFTEPLDRAQDMHGYYKQLIRDRLKTLWQKHRGDANSEDEVEIPRRIPVHRSKGRLKGISFHSSPHGHDSQIYMRDMMASMAQIMTAVGEIVTSNADSNYSNRRKRKGARSKSASSRPLSNHDDSAPIAGTDNFIIEMANAMNPHAKVNIPKRKSEVFDLVMQKLQVNINICIPYCFLIHLMMQAIERCENDIRDFLTKPTKDGLDRGVLVPGNLHDDGDALPKAATSFPQPLQVEPKVRLSVPHIQGECNVIEAFPKLVRFQDNSENEDIKQYMHEMNR